MIYTFVFLPAMHNNSNCSIIICNQTSYFYVLIGHSVSFLGKSWLFFFFFGQHIAWESFSAKDQSHATAVTKATAVTMLEMLILNLQSHWGTPKNLGSFFKLFFSLLICKCSLYILIFFFLFGLFLPFLGPLPRHMEVPRLGV